jgi:DNA invertase Pin-like site-specific DNA recombinase
LNRSRRALVLPSRSSADRTLTSADLLPDITGGRLNCCSKGANAMPTIRCALYARVSTSEQHPDNQIAELRHYCASRGWTVAREYIDHGVSGSKERRLALDELVRDAKRRRFDVLVCWPLDRLGRNLRHLVLLLEELHALGISFASLGEGIDATTPAGRLQMHMLAALSEFERGRIQERVNGRDHRRGAPARGCR